MTAQQLLMPKATAVWLVENTALTFKQIADFCQLHELEVQAIADDEADRGMKGLNPITSGQLSQEEIDKGQADLAYKLKLAPPKVVLPQTKSKRGPRYTPVSRRQDRPNAIMWLVRNHPELKDAQIIRLVGTTKHTIGQIRERTHWNAANLQPLDPVSLGLCSQLELDMEVRKAAKDAPAHAPIDGPTLLSADETTTAPNLQPRDAKSVFDTPGSDSEPKPAPEDDDIDADAVFAKLKGLKLDGDEN
ncbi:MAG: cell cycle transcriptional regulator TrcR [Pseudomonadota bacterium]